MILNYSNGLSREYPQPLPSTPSKKHLETMEEIAQELATHLVSQLKLKRPEERLLVGMAGVPGSGKSTLARRVVKLCNEILLQEASAPVAPLTNGEQQSSESSSCPNGLQQEVPEAILIGLDGWHLTRKQLDAFDDPVEAHARRGAHWTFDPAGFATFLSALRVPISSSSSKFEGGIPAPVFNHEDKDPVEGGVHVLPRHRIVVIEGLYAFLGIEAWRESAELFDERWFAELSSKDDKTPRLSFSTEKDEQPETTPSLWRVQAMDKLEGHSQMVTLRLMKRHVETGVAKDMKDALARAANSDMANGRFVIENMLRPTLWIQVFNDDSFAKSK